MARGKAKPSGEKRQSAAGKATPRGHKNKTSRRKDKPAKTATRSRTSKTGAHKVGELETPVPLPEGTPLQENAPEAVGSRTPPLAAASPGAKYRRAVSPLAGLLVLGGLVWLVLRERYYTGWVDDDAFISFRYARNLAQGHGLVFNVGERVEGYTNFLWTAILSLFYREDPDLPRAAQLLGGIFSIATVGVLVLIGRTGLLRPFRGPLVLVVGPLLLCLSEPWAAWTVGGLENVLSGFLLALCFWTYLLYLGSGRRIALASCALSLALAVLNHPSNLLFAVALGGQLLLQNIDWGRQPQVEPARATWSDSAHARRMPRAHALLFCLVFLVPVSTWTVWRLGYYGDLLPNTFYAKVGFTPLVLLRGLRYLVEVIQGFALPCAGTVALAIVLARRRLLHHPASILPVTVLLYTGYLVAVGGEQFPAFRALVVLLPFLALILQCVVNELCTALGSRQPTPSRTLQQAAGVGLVFALIVAGYVYPLYASARNRILDEALRLGRTALSTAAALRLKEALPPETLFAHSGAGLIAYYTNFRWIDTLGLTDRHIGHTSGVDIGKGAAGHEKGDGAYVWSRKPDYVMFPGYPISDRKPGTKSDRELFAIREFHSTYRSIVFPFRFQGPHDDVPREHQLYLWKRIDSAAPR